MSEELKARIEMHFKSVSDVLQDHGCAHPTLNALTPNVSNYKAMMFQPHGEIEASVDGVFSKDRPFAKKQFSKFLELAHQEEADLVVTPEYSMPWGVLKNAVETGVAPASGKLWVLGCESIKLNELNTLKAQLEPIAKVIFEPLTAQQNRFLDPLAYVFLTPLAVGGGTRLIILVQFKTKPMADSDHFEVNGLQLGSHIYTFARTANDIRLASLICSDAFGLLDPQAEEIYSRTFIIHLQLNPKPRHEEFRRYRDRLLRFGCTELEVVCLNWACDVVEWSGAKENPWKNVAASAWYLKPETFDSRDDTLSHNHRRGLYYTWLSTHRYHVLFFNYAPAVFKLTATKVFHHGVSAVESRRRGPQLTKVYTWSAAENWAEQDKCDDEFSSIANEAGAAKAALEKMRSENPISAERVIALCSGNIRDEIKWHDVRELNACRIDSTEIVKRVTFCQDNDAAASTYRIAQLRRCAILASILKDDALLPRALDDVKNGFEFEWKASAPHQNIYAKKGPATVIYMGEESTVEMVEAKKKRVAEYLHRETSSADESLTAKQRLAVWYRDNGALKLVKPDEFIQIDKPDSASQFDIARAE
jgi:hypothetical protein